MDAVMKIREVSKKGDLARGQDSGQQPETQLGVRQSQTRGLCDLALGTIMGKSVLVTPYLG